jgi:hypothetical protein
MDAWKIGAAVALVAAAGVGLKLVSPYMESEDSRAQAALSRDLDAWAEKGDPFTPKTLAEIDRGRAKALLARCDQQQWTRISQGAPEGPPTYYFTCRKGGVTLFYQVRFTEGAFGKSTSTLVACGAPDCRATKALFDKAA